MCISFSRGLNKCDTCENFCHANRGCKCRVMRGSVGGGKRGLISGANASDIIDWSDQTNHGSGAIVDGNNARGNKNGGRAKGAKVEDQVVEEAEQVHWIQPWITKYLNH